MSRKKIGDYEQATSLGDKLSVLDLSDLPALRQNFTLVSDSAALPDLPRFNFILGGERLGHAQFDLWPHRKTADWMSFYPLGNYVADLSGYGIGTMAHVESLLRLMELRVDEMWDIRHTPGLLFDGRVDHLHAMGLHAGTNGFGEYLKKSIEFARTRGLQYELPF
jgi:hypothetical protein